MHLQIKPGLRTAWRAPDAVQIGLDPRRGAVLEGLTAADRSLMDQLCEGLDDSALAGGGPAAERARRLLGLLRSTDVLVARRAGRGALAQVGPASQRLAPDAAVWGVVHPGDGDGWDLMAARSRRARSAPGPPPGRALSSSPPDSCSTRPRSAAVSPSSTAPRAGSSPIWTASAARHAVRSPGLI